VATVQLATFLVMLAVVAPLSIVVRGGLDVSLLLLPLIVVLLFCLVLGLSMAVAVLHAHFRDVEPVLATALLPWFFLTPIFLPIDSMPGIAEHGWVGDVLRWGNPIAPFIEATRDVLYSGAAPSAGTLVYVLVAGLVGLGLGALLFRRLQRDLAVIL
jgi:ABC-type polysaccharide/polyol phosphate export permease